MSKRVRARFSALAEEWAAAVLEEFPKDSIVQQVVNEVLYLSDLKSKLSASGGQRAQAAAVPVPFRGGSSAARGGAGGPLAACSGRRSSRRQSYAALPHRVLHSGEGQALGRQRQEVCHLLRGLPR